MPPKPFPAPTRQPALVLVALFLIGVASIVACRGDGPSQSPPAGARTDGSRDPSSLGTQAHLDLVMTSASCAACHPAIYAEHEQSAHGRAFIDEETRIATRDFRREDCVRCHTPRPIFETGIGMTPMTRGTDLEEGNTCMSCHWKQGYDYSRFTGGPECKRAFDPRVGTVQACASCHRVAGTPDQWSRAAHGSQAGNVCVDCHMPVVERPVAVGETPRAVHAHTYPAAHSESQLRRAYASETRIEGSEVVVRITNKGVGHNFPTANRQRALESLVTVRDHDGAVVGSSRWVCRYPYASELAPGQLTMPAGTQIPSGKTIEHRMPITVGSGTVETDLFFKLYRPCADYDPQLSRRLEHQTIPFGGLVPSTAEIHDAAAVSFPAPAADLDDFFDPAGFANVARPPPGSGPVEIPQGKDPAEIRRLIALLEFHMPEARRLARERLRALGPAAFPALVDALGAWSNETFNQAIDLLASAGEPAVPVLVAALESPSLYVRCHARGALARMGPARDRAAVLKSLLPGLRMSTPLDRRSAALSLGELFEHSAAVEIRKLLLDADWDVVTAAAQALARLDDRDSVTAIENALARAGFVETKWQLSIALCELGSTAGVPALLDGLDHPDALMRASCFEALFAVTGRHFGYEPAAPHGERMEALARWRVFWTESGGPGELHRRRRIDARLSEHALQLVMHLGGGTDTEAGGDDDAIRSELVGMGSDAVPALIEGLTFPSGYAQKRALVCQALGRIGSHDAAPFLMAALRDPSPSVAASACDALATTGDVDVLPALARYREHVLELRADQRQRDAADLALAHAARTAWTLGDEHARDDLVSLLLSQQREVRDLAIRALEARSGDRRGYDPDAGPEARAAAAARWLR